MKAFAAFSMLLFVASTVFPQEDVTSASAQQRWLHDAARAAAKTVDANACPGTTVTPPYSTTATLTGFECKDVLGDPEIVYTFHGKVGDVIKIEVSSTAFELFLYMYLGNGTSAPTSDPSYLTSGISRRKIVYTIPTERNYDIEISALLAGTSAPQTGPFSFQITNSNDQSSGCAPQPLDSLFFMSRFRVELTARDQRTGTTGTGVAFKQNESYGLFAVPALTGNTTDPVVFVKLLDGRPVNGKFWVFYSGLTDVEYTITVTDTILGLTKTYHNPPGSTQGGFDTNAF